MFENTAPKHSKPPLNAVTPVSATEGVFDIDVITTGPTPFDITVDVADSAGSSASLLLQVNVSGSNTSPILNINQRVPTDAEDLSISVVKGSHFSVLATEFDPDQRGSLTYTAVSNNNSVASVPTGVSSTGLFTVTTSTAGAAVIRFDVSDGSGVIDSKNLEVIVQSQNESPTISLNPYNPITVKTGQTIRVTVKATAPGLGNGDALNFAVSNGQLHYIAAPVAGNPGVFDVEVLAVGPASADITFSVSDSAGNQVSTVLRLDVAEIC